jgi:3',5'-cyclic AMP phosphodiesterase CpdA
MKMERRSALKSIGGLLLMPTLGFGDTTKNDNPVLRIAHLTDIHLKDKFDAPARFAACLHHVQQQNPKVDMILNGGDVVFDMNKESIGTINDQWQLYHNSIKNDCSIPVSYCLGNHDIWWYEADKGQALYGKKYAMEQLKLVKPWYSMVKNGWKIIVLDSVHLDIDGTWYIGKLGEEQFGWLTDELKATDKDMPVMVMTHIPILTALLMIEDNIVNKWTMLGGDMHTDTAKIIDLFYQHPNVKLCVSGHLHMRDKVTLL